MTGSWPVKGCTYQVPPACRIWMLSDAIYFSLVLTPLSPHAVSMQSTDAVHLRKLLTFKKGSDIDCKKAREISNSELRDCRVVKNVIIPGCPSGSP